MLTCANCILGIETEIETGKIIVYAIFLIVINIPNPIRTRKNNIFIIKDINHVQNEKN